MHSYLGSVINRKLTTICDRLKYDQYCKQVHGQLVDTSSPDDRREALDDVPEYLENAMHSAWLAKDDLEFMRLYRELMYRFFEDTATNMAECYMEQGE